MKNIKKRFMLLSIIVLVFSLLYYLYPRSGSLNSFFLEHCNKENITKIVLRSTNYDIEKAIEYQNNPVDYDSNKYIKNKDEIDKILSNFSNIKLIEHYGSTSNRTKGSYYFYIYENSENNLQIAIHGKEYIEITDYVDKFKKIYKIIDDSLDINYLKRLVSE